MHPIKPPPIKLTAKAWANAEIPPFAAV